MTWLGQLDASRHNMDLKAPPKRELADLRNVGKAALADFRLVGVLSVEDLANREPDALYRGLCQITGQRHDPCVHDVFVATVHDQDRRGHGLVGVHARPQGAPAGRDIPGFRPGQRLARDVAHDQRIGAA